MILTVDVGNTNIVLGAYEGEKLLFSSRCAADRSRTEDEYALLLQGVLSLYGMDGCRIEGAILSSVVPVLRVVIPRAVKRLWGKTMLVVGPGIRTGLNIRLDNPAQMGSDLLVDAVAAKSLYQPPIVIFDMGTATTASVIDRRGDYIGGMIIPGLQVAMDSLSSRTAQLPYVDFTPPRSLIGRNTEECMQSGAVYGCAAMMDGLISRIEAELGERVTTVLTGGLAPIIAPLCTGKVHLQPELMLLGLKILYDKNAEKGVYHP